jgi:hypothetical protein
MDKQLQNNCRSTPETLETVRKEGELHETDSTKSHKTNDKDLYVELRTTRHRSIYFSQIAKLILPDFNDPWLCCRIKHGKPNI